jgi:hypothetical protein
MKRPVDIEVLIWYHYHTEHHPYINTPSVAQAIARWQSLGALELLSDGLFRTTDLGMKYVGRLCSIPDEDSGDFWAKGTAIPPESVSKVISDLVNYLKVHTGDSYVAWRSGRVNVIAMRGPSKISVVVTEDYRELIYED